MKNYKLTYNEQGYLKEPIEADEFYIAQQEHDSVSVSATFPAMLVGSVKAYVEFTGGGDIIECENITVNKHTATATLSSDYLKYHYLLIGFEVDTGTKQIRFEPIELEVNKFVNPTGSASPSAYTVTVNIGNVTELEPGEAPFVTNSGTDKHPVFNFGIPRGNTGERGIQGEQGPQGLPGNDGYTPVKGVDYFTEEDIAGLGIANKVDKADGKGLSTNDFTDELKSKVENNTFDSVIKIESGEGYLNYNDLKKMDVPEGISVIYAKVSQGTTYEYGLVIKSYGDYKQMVVITPQGEVLETHYDDSAESWTEWTSPYASTSTVGDIETALDRIIAMQNLLIGGDE